MQVHTHQGDELGGQGEVTQMVKSPQPGTVEVKQAFDMREAVEVSHMCVCHYAHYFSDVGAVSHCTRAFQ